MALTRDFKETIRARVKRDPGFRKALLREGIEKFLSGDVETGKGFSPIAGLPATSFTPRSQKTATSCTHR